MSDKLWVARAQVRAFDVIEWDNPYVELFWLPTIGPSATWLYRRMCLRLIGEPDGYTMEPEEFGHLVGLHGAGGANSAVRKTFTRLAQFNITKEQGWTLEVRTVLPILTDKQVAHLPEQLRSAHPAWHGAVGSRPLTHSTQGV